MPGQEAGFIRWPNLFLVGAPRCGTTSFYGYLGQHPEIYMSPVKEPGFFSIGTGRRRWMKKMLDETHYLDLFRAARAEKIRGEASAEYLWMRTAPSRIHARSPEAKILIMLRDPVERAYSHYLLDVKDGVERRSFADVLQEPDPRAIASYADLGLYCEQVRRYVDQFRSNVLVLFFEEVFVDIRGALRRTFDFLGVDPDFADLVRVEPQQQYARPRNLPSKVVVRTAAGVRSRLGRPLLPAAVRPLARRLVLTAGKKPPMDPESRAYLEALYADQCTCLSRLLGVTPPWPSASTGRQLSK